MGGRNTNVSYLHVFFHSRPYYAKEELETRFLSTKTTVHSKDKSQGADSAFLG